MNQVPTPSRLANFTRSVDLLESNPDNSTTKMQPASVETQTGPVGIDSATADLVTDKEREQGSAAPVLIDKYEPICRQIRKKKCFPILSYMGWALWASGTLAIVVPLLQIVFELLIKRHLVNGRELLSTVPYVLSSAVTVTLGTLFVKAGREC